MEEEPNDAAPAGEPLALNTTVVGSFDTAGDTDWFVLPLEGGQPVTLWMRPWCDEVVDPTLSVYDTTGGAKELLATDDDLAGLGYPKIQVFVPKEDGDYYLRVRDEHSSLGGWVLDVLDAACTQDVDWTWPCSPFWSSRSAAIPTPSSRASSRRCATTR